MPEQTPSKKSLLRDLTPLWLLIALIAITVLHDENVSGSALLHEISQRLYYLPIIYAAYRYGLRGGLTASLVSAALYFPHIVQHWNSEDSAINLYAETIAKAIHQHSARRDGPFVVINCGAIPEGLLESELFGHRKGAFTGAYSNARGKIEAADKGTVLLDEIGELSPALQVKLLRVIEGGEFTRVGETETRRADVRFLAATNRDLSKMVEDGRFREDLYFRLKVVPIHLPPLRERREDIPLLADHFLRDAAKRFGRPALRFEKDVFRYFQAYAWPGNVRELKHTVERLAVIAENDNVSSKDLPENLTATTTAAANVLIQLPDDGIDLEEVEREILRQALEKHAGNQTRAAQYLNITRSALIYRMQKYGLQQPETLNPSAEGRRDEVVG